jgi:hypothetical protein
MTTFSKISTLGLTLCFLLLSLGCSDNIDRDKAESLLKEHEEILDKAKAVEADMQEALDKRIRSIEEE